MGLVAGEEVIASTEVPRAGVDVGRHFYVVIAALFVVLTFAGFIPSYWAPMGDGSLEMHAAIHAHAALFFLWTLYVLTQAVLVAQGRTLAHREWGIFGVALASAMVFSGVVASIVQLSLLMGTPRERLVIGTAILGFTSMIMFAIFIAGAVANVRRPEWHKRLMVLATFSIMQAVVVRYILLIPGVSQPHRAFAAAIIIDLLLLAVIFADARIKGRVHPVYLAGGALIVFVQVARSPVTHTPLWRDACLWLASLAG